MGAGPSGAGGSCLLFRSDADEGKPCRDLSVAFAARRLEKTFECEGDGGVRHADAQKRRRLAHRMSAKLRVRSSVSGGSDAVRRESHNHTISKQPNNFKGRQACGKVTLESQEIPEEIDRDVVSAPRHIPKRCLPLWHRITIAQHLTFVVGCLKFYL